MKGIKIGIVAVVVAGLAIALLFQHRELQKVREDFDQARQENETILQDQANRVAALEAENKRLASVAATATTPAAAQQAQYNELLKLRGEVTSLANAAANAAANPATNAAGNSPMAEMLKSPEMKEMIKTVLEGTIDKSYGAFFTNLNLGPEQTAALKDLIVRKQLAGADTAMAAMTDPDASKRKEAIARVKADSESMDAQIKQFLGEENFAQLKAYEKTVPTRQQVTAFKDQLGAGSALNADQEQQLIQAMNQERQNFKFTTDYSDQNAIMGDPGTYFAEERIKQFQQEQEQLNQRFLERARTILTTGQFESYQQSIAKQQAMMIMSMQMSAKFFTPKPPGR